jgi:hypothetical protein
MFIPDEWINRSHRLIFQLTAKGDLVFVNKAEIAVIKRGIGHKAILNDPPPYSSIGPSNEYLATSSYTSERKMSYTSERKMSYTSERKMSYSSERSSQP